MGEQWFRDMLGVGGGFGMAFPQQQQQQMPDAQTLAWQQAMRANMQNANQDLHFLGTKAPAVTAQREPEPREEFRKWGLLVFSFTPRGGH